MKKVMQKLSDFVDNVSSQSEGVKISDISRTELDRYVSDNVTHSNEDVSYAINDIEEVSGIEVDVTDELVCLVYLSDQGLNWSRPEKKSNEGFLSGGFYINGILDIFSYPVDFWKDSLVDFEKNGISGASKMPENIRWFESPVAHNSSIYKPFYGCVIVDSESLSDQFYFYDNGLLYKLPFSSFEEYFEAMINSAAVECWQLFYIDPEEIVKKTKGVSYITWIQYLNSYLDERMHSLKLDKDVKFDRLDLVNEYLERCVRLLPDTFPFIDFSQHKDYYTKFKKLYDKEKS